MKSKLIHEKSEEENARLKAEQEMFTYSKRQEEHQDEFTQSMNAIQVQLSLKQLQKLYQNDKKLNIFFTQNEILKLEKCRRDLMDELRRRNGELEERRAESTKLKQKFKVAMKKVQIALCILNNI